MTPSDVIPLNHLTAVEETSKLAHFAAPIEPHPRGWYTGTPVDACTRAAPRRRRFAGSYINSE
jgi:hypothetical protein